MRLDSFYGVVSPFIFTTKTKENNLDSNLRRSICFVSWYSLLLLACSQVRRMVHHGNKEKPCVARLTVVGNGGVSSSTPFSEYAVLNKNILFEVCKMAYSLGSLTRHSMKDSTTLIIT